MITNVCMIVLKEHDFNAAISFYKMIGLTLKFQLKDSWAEFELGGVKIGLCPTTQEPVERQTGVVLQITDLKKFYQDHKDAIPFKNEPIEKVHGIIATIKDPGGNLIDLYEPTPDKVQELVKKVVQEDVQKGLQSGDTEAFAGVGPLFDA